MSSHAVVGPTFPVAWPGLIDAVTAAIRAPSSVDWNAQTSTATYIFTPDLTAGQATTFANTVAAVRAGGVIPATDYAAISPQLATFRAWLAQNQSTFIGLTQNERDRMIFDNISAIERVIFRLLRE